MSKLILFSLALILSISTSTACELEIKPGVCVELSFKNKPSRKASSDFTIKFIDKKTKALVMPKEEVFVYLWMKMPSGHEHGSDPVKLEKKNNIYEASNVWFLMLGNWQVHVQLREGGVVKHKTVKVICVAREGESC